MTTQNDGTSLASGRAQGIYDHQYHWHQQYLEKNPNGYCGIGPNGMTCPIGVASTGG
jgi:hypothetical protein